MLYSFYYIDESISGKSLLDESWATESSGPLNNNWIITLEKPAALLTMPANRMAFTIFIILFICV